jgi:hypothetical protein
VLGNPGRRAAYDQALAREQTPPSTSWPPEPADGRRRRGCSGRRRCGQDQSGWKARPGAGTGPAGRGGHQARRTGRTGLAISRPGLEPAVVNPGWADLDRGLFSISVAAGGLNLAGIRRVLELQEETRQLQAELTRLRALAGDRAAPRSAARQPACDLVEQPRSGRRSRTGGGYIGGGRQHLTQDRLRAQEPELATTRTSATPHRGTPGFTNGPVPCRVRPGRAAGRRAHRPDVPPARYGRAGG